MAKAKAGQKRQQSNVAKKQNKKQKHTAIPKSSPDLIPEDDLISNDIQDIAGNDLFDNLDEEMDPNGLDDIVKELEAGSDDSEIEDEEKEEDNIDAMSEDEEGNSSEQEEKEEEDEERIKKPASKPKFRDHYMGQITRAFGSDLDKIRQEPTFNASQLPILIDSLESGIDIFSNLEQEIILTDAVQD
ncbi:ribosome-assembly protein 3-domain-containing protein [Phascolomyces articulosus]|uniref:Ribosome assembly protein 3 n=1 Tax=Phascolomyces articulosus TaxID=60185 RepID=A0AAD5K400_9FUNG|nr:ribosome-assembly protein 3-domain-containing protein [Phascolomyces articulosus]